MTIYQIRRSFYFQPWRIEDSQGKLLAMIFRPKLPLMLWLLVFIAMYLAAIFGLAALPPGLPHWLLMTVVFSAILGPIIVFYVFSPPRTITLFTGQIQNAIWRIKQPSWCRFAWKTFSVQDAHDSLLGTVSILGWEVKNSEGSPSIHTRINQDALKMVAWWMVFLGGSMATPTMMGSYNADFYLSHQKASVPCATLKRNWKHNYELTVNEDTVQDWRLLLAVCALRMEYENS